MINASETAARQLLSAQPDLAFFYLIDLTYTTGSVGDNTFHSLATDPQICRATIHRLCVEQKAAWEETVAEINELPPEEEPYDPFLPDGCSATLCIVLPEQHYVYIQSQHWDNRGHSLHPAELPDIFDTAYYLDKVRRGDYQRHRVKS